MRRRASAGGTGDLRDRSDASELGIRVPVALYAERLRGRRVEPAPWDQALRAALSACVRGVPSGRDRLAEATLTARFEHHLGEARLTPVGDRVVTDRARHHAVGAGQIGHDRGIGGRPADLKKIGPQGPLVLRPAGGGTPPPPPPPPPPGPRAGGGGCAPPLFALGT